MSTKEEDLIQAQIKAKNWWRWFWATILFLFVLYAGALYLGEYGETNYDINTTKGRENYSKKMLSLMKNITPGLIKDISNLSKESKEKIKNQIQKEVAKAYAPVLDKGIKNFSDFHYSVWGEYTELYYKGGDKAKELLVDQKYNEFEKMIYEKLFASTGFDANLKNAYTNVNTFALNEIRSTIAKIHTKVQNDLNTTNEQTNFLIEEMFKISIKDMEERFKDDISIEMHASGLGGGAVIGAMASKQIAKVFAKKIATKVAIKGGSKLAGTAAGAALGASEGLLCGPGAVLCSPVGAFVGGVIGWFATDAGIMIIDENNNRDDFEKELKTMIKQQQAKTQEQLYKVYTNSIDTFNKANQEKLEAFKHTKNIKHL